MPLPKDFIEACRMPCPFCGKDVRTGLLYEKPYGQHAAPHCVVFKQCDDIVQFGMVMHLKLRTDTGQRVIN
jgi:hypothetical protein